MDKYFKLPDGRQICYTEYGDSEGQPIIAFHGNPNSRLIWGAIHEISRYSQVRMIAPDRPGYGQTDYVEGITTLENWPVDISALSDHLGIDKFAVFGVSGGGPYALSCALRIPKQITCAGIFGSVGPFIDETDIGINKITRALWKFGPKMPGLLKQQMKFFSWLAAKHPSIFVRIVINEFGKQDKEIYDRLNLSNRLHQNRIEAYRQKGIGSWHDSLIPPNWDLPLEDIKTKVYLWQGEDDITVPLSMGKYMANKIPGCEAKFIVNAGHLWIMEHFDEIIKKIVEC